MVELMIAVSILVIAAMTVETVARVAFNYALFHESALTAQDEARRALQLMVAELRQARRPTLTTQTLPNNSVTFQIPEDADGNGLPVDVGGYLESLGMITYMRDMNDMNGDGLTNQLIRVYQSGGSGAAANVTVIANDIMPNEDVNWDETLNPGEDSNGSRMLERGIWFDWAGPLLRITVDTQKTVGAEGRLAWSTVTADVCPRN